MRLLDGEETVLTTPGGEILVTNLRISQRAGGVSEEYVNHIFLRHVTGCEVVPRRRASRLMGVAAVLALALASLLLGEAEGVCIALACLPVFWALFYFSTDKTLEVFSHASSIMQPLRISGKAEKALIGTLRRLTAAQKAAKPL